MDQQAKPMPLDMLITIGVVTFIGTAAFFALFGVFNGYTLSTAAMACLAVIAVGWVFHFCAWLFRGPDLPVKGICTAMVSSALFVVGVYVYPALLQSMAA